MNGQILLKITCFLSRLFHTKPYDQTPACKNQKTDSSEHKMFIYNSKHQCKGLLSPYLNTSLLFEYQTKTHQPIIIQVVQKAYGSEHESQSEWRRAGNRMLLHYKQQRSPDAFNHKEVGYQVTKTKNRAKRES